MPSKQEIEVEIARLKKLPETPTRLREIKALQRCLGLEITPARGPRAKPSASSSRGLPPGPRTVRKRAPLVDNEIENEDTLESAPRKSDFNAANYLGDLLDSHHAGMS